MPPICFLNPFSFLVHRRLSPIPLVSKGSGQTDTLLVVPEEVWEVSRTILANEQATLTSSQRETLFGLLASQSTLQQVDQGMAVLQSDMQAMAAQMKQSIDEFGTDQVTLTRDEVARMFANSAFLTERLTLLFDDPRIPGIQAQLQQVLALQCDASRRAIDEYADSVTSSQGSGLHDSRRVATTSNRDNEVNR